MGFVLSSPDFLALVLFLDLGWVEGIGLLWEKKREKMVVVGGG